MADTENKVPVGRDEDKGPAMQRRGGWGPFDMLQREAERMFGELNRSFGMPMPRGWLRGRAGARDESGWLVPAVDFAEKDGRYEITAELPGMDENNIEIRVVGHTVTIRGEKSEEMEDQRKDLSVSERHYGSFERSFAVPEDADVENVTASFKQGVLTVTLPKKPGPDRSVRTIPVEAK
jgi:HSP20 family protein